MSKLTYLEATKILTEAYRLKAQFKSSGSRLGQSIHWTCNPEISSLDKSLQDKLLSLLDADHTSPNDFYHWMDEDKVFATFYIRYVEEGGL